MKNKLMGGIIGADIVSKYLAMKYIPLEGIQFNSWAGIIPVYNSTPASVAVMVLVLIFVYLIALTTPIRDIKLPMYVIFAGGFANLISYVMGAPGVPDFIAIQLVKDAPHVFNLADVTIVTGAIFVLYYGLKHYIKLGLDKQ